MAWSEIRWPGRDALDEGLDVRTLELDPGGYAALEILGRSDVMGHLSDWRAGSALGMRMQASVMTSSALAMITVPRADPMWYLRGGSAMERFWPQRRNARPGRAAGVAGFPLRR